MPRAQGNVTKEKQLQLAKRRALIVDLVARDSTMTFERIAGVIAEAGLAPPTYSRTSCMKDWRAALRSFITEESATKQRAVQNLRYARLIRAVWQKALDGDTKAIDSIARLMAQQATLNGLNAPTRTALEISMHVTALAQVSIEAVGVGFDAAQISPAQRQQMLDAMRQHFHALEGRADVIELDAVGEAS